MKDQMELFEDGGLKDEGGMIDEESGNEVPVGGTRKGVRDDVPAMVSEGEFVFPEDVTRYIGLDKLMQMRQSAKMGLKRMEAMGQMGNSDEATMPDDMPFGVADLVIVSDDTGEELEMQEGGFVTSTSSYRTAPQQPVYSTPPTSPTPPSDTVSTTRRLTPELERPAKSSIDFKKLMGEASIEYVEYRNEAGNNMMIPHIGGVPMFPIPEGYTRYEASNEDSVENSDTEEAEVVKETNKISKDRPDRDISAEIQAEFDKAPPPINWGTLGTDELISQTDGITGMASNIATAGMFLLGPLAPLGLAAINQQNRDALAAITARIAEGNLSPEDLAKLTEQQGILEKKLGTVGSSIISNIVDGISTALGLSETITETAKAKVAESTSGVSAPKVAETLPEQVQPAETAPTPEEMLMQQPVKVAPAQTGDPEVFAYSPSVVDIKRPDVPITLGGGDPTLPSTTFAAAPTIPAPIDPYGVGQQGEFAGIEPPVIPSVVSLPQASPQKQTAKEYSDDLRSQGIIPSIADMQAAGYTDTEISSVGPASSPNALKVTIDKPTQTEDAFGIGQQGEFAMPAPVTPTAPVAPMAAGQQGAVTATTPTGYDEAGLNIDPRRQQGPKQAEVFQTQEAERMEIERQQTLADTQKRLEENKELFADAEKRLAEQLVVSASDIKNANDAAEARYNNDVATIRSEHTKRIDDLMKIGILDRAAAERKALELAKAEEEAAKRKMEAERKRIADAKAKSDAEAKRREEEDKRYKASLAATGTATRTGSAAPLTSIKPPSKPTAPAKPNTPKASNNKSTRLDSSNPNTNKNIDAHLSSTEKASLEANPSLAAHYTATANRRANEAASGDTSNTDSANEAADSGDDCCFIMLEARYGNGTMDMVVRKYRDEYMTDRNRRGYYKVAEVFVPLMRKYPVFKWFITKIFADPLVSYGKYHYNEKKIGVIFTPVKNFWMKLFDVVGGNTKFIRENGETI